MPADDDDEMNPEELVELEEEADDEIAGEPDVEELDDEDGDFGLEDADDDDDTVVDETDEDEDEDVDEPDVASTRTKRRVAGEEEDDEDDELLSPDDVEADLDRILKDRLVTVDDEDEDEDEDEPDERGDAGDRLQPKRADEQLCSHCFLLVRANAPGCPVGDDDCPIFT